MLTIGSLFSGIGGLELGLEWSGLGPTLWQVEQSEFCRDILARHWPEAARFCDVREVGAEQLEPVDLICGGFPCQDISSAGKGAGLSGERSGLWFEFARIIGEMRPRHVVIENVASGAKRWVDDVMAGLGQLGYEALPIPLSASDVGAPHKRARVFIVAHAHGSKLRVESGGGERSHRQGEAELASHGETRTTPHSHSHSQSAKPQHEQVEGLPAVAVYGWWARRSAPPAVRRVVDGVRAELDGARNSALGNAVVPQCAEVVGWVIRELMGDA